MVQPQQLASTVLGHSSHFPLGRTLTRTHAPTRYNKPCCRTHPFIRQSNHPFIQKSINPSSAALSRHPTPPKTIRGSLLSPHAYARFRTPKKETKIMVERSNHPPICLKNTGWAFAVWS